MSVYVESAKEVLVQKSQTFFRLIQEAVGCHLENFAILDILENMDWGDGTAVSWLCLSCFC